jgi:hypothetical protein
MTSSMNLETQESAPSETSEGTLPTTTNWWLELYRLNWDVFQVLLLVKSNHRVILAFLRLDGGLR